jgi:PncC family amidohydrolase
MESRVYIDVSDEGYNDKETKIEEEVGVLLINKDLSISTAESCTGGLLSGKLINYPGISSVFIEGAVTYSNEAKMNRLGVKKETLEKYGAVSAETACEMAIGIVKVSGSDIGISITGIAGPSGGTTEKPVGLIYIGLHINGKVKVQQYNFSGERQTIRDKTVTAALKLLKKELEINI